MPNITLSQLHITIAKANAVTPPNKVKYLITTKSSNTTPKTYIFAPNQPTLLLALSIARYLRQTSSSASIIQIENLFTNAKLYA